MTALETLERMQEWVRTVQTPECFWHALVLKGRETANLRLWTARLRAGWDEERMAENLGMLPADYRRLESNGAYIPPPTLQRVSALLQVPERWLACAPEGAGLADIFGRTKPASDSVAASLQWGRPLSGGNARLTTDQELRANQFMAFYKDKRVLVTGGAGFIGSHLVDGLLEAGARVRVMDNLATGRKANLAHRLDRIEFHEADIRDFEACRSAVAGAEMVFHQAALGSVPRSMEHPEFSLDVNVRGTLNVFTACRDAGVKRVVYASSSSVYGDSERLPKVEGQEGTPLSPYAWSKRANEEMAAVFHRCYGMDLIGLRYFNAFGPRQDPEGAYAAVIPRFFKAALSGQAPVIYGDGKQSRDFTYVGDVVAANLAAGSAEGAAWNRAYNIASGRRVSVLDLARAVVQQIGRPVEPEFGPPRPGDVKHSLADITAAKELLRHRPSVSFDEGLALSANYYRSLFA